MSVNESASPEKRLPTPKLREAAETAFKNGELEKASTLADALSERVNAGPWVKVLIGRIALANGNGKRAQEWLSKALEELPDEGSVLVELAASFAAQNNWKSAVRTLGRALSQRPDIAELHERHGIYLANAGQQDEADQAFAQALVLNPNSASALTHIGERHLLEGRLQDARNAFERALDLDETNKIALSNLALVHEQDGDPSAALNVLTQLREIDPRDAAVQQRCGLLQLALGQFSEGWRLYARRRKNKNYASWQSAVRIPYWQGEDIADKSLLVWTDQGLGEQILTASLLPEIMGRANTVTLACDPRLVDLFQRSFPSIHVVSLEATRNDGEGIGHVDIQASISELGAVLRPGTDAFPAPRPFLVPDETRAQEFRRQLIGADDQRLVGISWRSANPIAGDVKSTDLSGDWRAILSNRDATFVSLQYGDVGQEIAKAMDALGVEIVRVPDLDFERDVDGFVSLVAAMDSVISISNTAVHVAGGLGIPVRAMVPKGYGCPWYWMAQGDRSLWYPTVTLYSSSNSWSETAKVLAADAFNEEGR